ncbi:hypothetical protein BH10PSE19_BH10PSE19_07570 [soil metagenome]
MTSNLWHMVEAISKHDLNSAEVFYNACYQDCYNPTLQQRMNKIGVVIGLIIGFVIAITAIVVTSVMSGGGAIPLWAGILNAILPPIVGALSGDLFEEWKATSPMRSLARPAVAVINHPSSDVEMSTISKVDASKSSVTSSHERPLPSAPDAEPDVDADAVPYQSSLSPKMR